MDFLGEDIFGRNSLFVLLKSANRNWCFCQDFEVILSKWKEGRKNFRSLKYFSYFAL